MRTFGNGQPRTPESTEQRIRGMWMHRFQNEQPHGGLTVFNHEDRMMGSVVAGTGINQACQSLLMHCYQDIGDTGWHLNLWN